ncbi:Pol polyprotein [Cucumispora dikerogammari]|nr:Pol polyprotein [Cucumispora dikerogammari]
MTNTVSLGLTSIGRLRVKKKARLFVFENELLIIIKNSVKKNYLYEHETARMREACNLFHLPRHLGRNALREAISTQYFGVSTKFIYNYVNHCIGCQRESVHVPTTSLAPIISSFVRERSIVDTIDHSEYQESNDSIKYIFTMIDFFSKFAFCYPVESKTVQNFLRSLKQLYLRESSWKILHSDNGSEFVANRVDGLARSMGPEPLQGPPYRFQTQEQIERFNRTIKSQLRRYFGTDNRRYVDVIDDIVFQYNKTKHKATRLSPFINFKGYDPSDTTWQYQDNFFDIQRVRANCARYVLAYKTVYDERVAAQNICVGQ